MSTRYLVTELGRRGHEIAIVTSSRKRSVSGVLDLTAAKLLGWTRLHFDSTAQYVASSSIDPISAQQRVMCDFDPDVVVVTATHPGLANAALTNSLHKPTVLYVRDKASAPVALNPHVDLVLANSEYMAGVVRALGVDATFLPSLFPSERYRLSPVREKVLFVNPIPKKGVTIALALARLRPDIPFVFNLSWRIQPKALRRLRRCARILGNVEIRKATDDPAVLFRDCRVLLVPSQGAEAWARVVSEAQISAIPSISSRVGGLPESVGPGGILVDPADSEDAWFAALSQVWDDPAKYDRLCRQALIHSQRRQLSPEAVTSSFERLLHASINRHADCPQSSMSPVRASAGETE